MEATLEKLSIASLALDEPALVAALATATKQFRMDEHPDEAVRAAVSAAAALAAAVQAAAAGLAASAASLALDALDAALAEANAIGYGAAPAVCGADEVRAARELRERVMACVGGLAQHSERLDGDALEAAIAEADDLGVTNGRAVAVIYLSACLCNG